MSQRVWCAAWVVFSAALHLLGARGQVLPVTPGSFQLLVGNGGVSAMHMFLTIANTVVLFDRTDYGPSQILLPNGTCRNDPKDLALTVDCYAHSVELDLGSNAVRPLFIFSDTWCSSGATAANGTLIHTGGYNDGEKVVREFRPCSDGSCDWIELPASQAQLAVKRWYATNHILPDGKSSIVVGGTGAFSYEFVPRPAGQGAINFPFLRQTNLQGVQNNLYPFVLLMPDGNLFIFANNQSIAFNYKTNTVVKTYPVLNSGGGGRNYPSTGSAVLLPLLARQGFSRAEVLVCGGAPVDAFQQANKKVFVQALTDCGRLTITDPNPAWRIETMPTSWVMMDMVLLPTQEVLMINGAALGVAGWGLAENPVLSPALYRPNGSFGSRFTPLGATTIPRMYHSTAVLLPDTRVLVGGSNTHAGYVFTGKYPTELRLEAYSPYYLDAGHANLRPIITSLSTKTAAYGSSVKVTFSLATIPNFRFAVTLYHPPFTTHSFGQGQRLLMLANTIPVSAGGGVYTTTVTVPDNNVHAPAGYHLLFLVNSGVPSAGVWLQLA